jgi:hypothetical protein
MISRDTSDVGGKIEDCITSKTSHIVASSYTNILFALRMLKIPVIFYLKLLLTIKDRISVHSASWLTESLKQGKMLSCWEHRLTPPDASSLQNLTSCHVHKPHINYFSVNSVLLTSLVPKCKEHKIHSIVKYVVRAYRYVNIICKEKRR